MSCKGFPSFIEFSLHNDSETSNTQAANKKIKKIKDVMEKISILDIKQIHEYTSIIQLKKIEKEVKSVFKDLLIDLYLYKNFTQNKIINYSQNLCKLYPIKTASDGNCLCHAVMIYLIGMHDSSNLLRYTLNFYLNGTHQDELKKRFYRTRRIAGNEKSITQSSKFIVQEWNEIKQVSKIERERFVDLGDIHVFALANLLKRTIIILSTEKTRDIQNNDIRGIYFPLLCDEVECIKEPIIIGYDSYHFFPLVYADDYEELNFKFHFLDLLVSFDENNDYLFQTIENANDTKNKNKLTGFTYFPLVYANIESMAIHFLIANEEKDVRTLYYKYLNIVEVPYKPQSNQTIDEQPIICCKLGRKKYSNNGFNIFFSNINSWDENILSDMIYKCKLCSNDAVTKNGYCKECDEVFKNSETRLRSTEIKDSASHYICRSCYREYSNWNLNGYCDECKQKVNPNKRNINVYEILLENSSEYKGSSNIEAKRRKVDSTCRYPSCSRYADNNGYCVFHKV